MTDIIARRESPGFDYANDFVAEGDEQFRRKMLLAFSERFLLRRIPSENRRAIMFVIFDDKSSRFLSFQTASWKSET